MNKTLLYSWLGITAMLAILTVCLQNLLAFMIVLILAMVIVVDYYSMKEQSHIISKLIDGFLHLTKKYKELEQKIELYESTEGTLHHTED